MVWSRPWIQSHSLSSNVYLTTPTLVRFRGGLLEGSHLYIYGEALAGKDRKGIAAHCVRFDGTVRPFIAHGTGKGRLHGEDRSTPGERDHG